MDEATLLLHMMTRLVFQLAAIVLAARFLGYLVSRFLKQPSVLGELLAGMLIGPYALGAVHLPFLGNEPLFAIIPGASIPITPELYGFATVASIVLLFISGLETDLGTFLRFAGVGALTGLGGMILSFCLGAGSAILILPNVNHLMDPKALFMGIIATATSVGITARILSDRRMLSSPEGVTILSAAVLDDVMGIVFLAVVVGLHRGGSNTAGEVDWGLVARTALKAIGFWVGSTVVGILLVPRLTKSLKQLKDLEFLAMFALGLALLLAGFSETVGLAMIIGSYVMGLAFSSTDVAEDMRHRLEGIYNFIVPIFFCVMGMLVNFAIMPKVFVYGLLYAFLGIIGKLVGAGGMALFGGFNLKGAFRIGTGMIPRGEVTLIMAGLGLSIGVLDQGLFGVTIMTMFLSSIAAPPIIQLAFHGGSGYKGKLQQSSRGKHRIIAFEMPDESLASFVLSRLIVAFQQAEFFPRRVSSRKPVYIIRKNAIQISLIQEENTIEVSVPPDQEAFVRLLLMEEILSLKELFRNVGEVSDSDFMERNMVSSLFGGINVSDKEQNTEDGTTPDPSDNTEKI